MNPYEGIHPEDVPVEAFECDDCLRKRQEDIRNE